jgi:hypothetical protein
MRNADDIESYLIQMETPYETLGNNMWVIKGMGPDRVVSIADTVVVFRMKVLELDKVAKGRKETFFKTLLELNAGDMLHGAYGIQGDAVVISAALQLENLDFNEFQAAMEELDLAMSTHYGKLAELAA